MGMEKSSCKVSVLVAVYNSEDYLGQCLDSLRWQTMGNLQVICVDDASTDRSLEILRQYQAIDPRIEVIGLPENHGQAYARNVALRQARGEYICFLDSDDWMADDSLEKAVSVFAEHPRTGCVLFHTLYYYSASRIEPFAMAPFDVISGYDAFVESLTWKIHGVYMVKADIHQRFPYDESAHAFSDDNATRLHYLASEEVRTCSGIYYYRQHADSVSHQTSIRRFDYLTANTSMRNMLVDLSLNSDIIDIYENHRWLNVVDIYMFYFRYRHGLKPTDAAQGLAEIRRAWETIEPGRLLPRNRFKFGYCPMKPFWWLFRLQEELYFTLRKMLKGY